jgi:hypothetical protein
MRRYTDDTMASLATMMGMYPGVRPGPSNAAELQAPNGQSQVPHASGSGFAITPREVKIQ